MDGGGGVWDSGEWRITGGFEVEGKGRGGHDG